MSNYLFTSESVSEGHPDKVADQISDAILDAIIEQDTSARVACETMVTTGMVLSAGEITTSAWVDMANVARQTVKEIGYNSSDMGFDWQSCAILTSIDKQSPDIAQGVDAIGVSCNDPDGCIDPINTAVEAGIEVMTWDSDAPDSNRFTYLGVSNYDGGRAAADLRPGLSPRPLRGLRRGGHPSRGELRAPRRRRAVHRTARSRAGRDSPGV